MHASMPFLPKDVPGVLVNSNLSMCHTPSISKYLSFLTFILTLIIFDFFITLIFLIRRIIKVIVKVKDNKYLRFDGVVSIFLVCSGVRSFFDPSKRILKEKLMALEVP
jgi:hypothetical protein